MIRIDGLEISYNGNNGWSYRKEGETVTRPCAVNDRFGDGSAITNMMGNVLATPGVEAIAAEMADWSAARDQRRVTEGTIATNRSGNGSVSAYEYDNLRGSLGDAAARDMARQMQG